MNLLQKIIYFCLSVKEKGLRLRLDKHLKRKAVNSTSKTVFQSGASLILNSETKKNIEIVRLNMLDLVKNSEYNVDFLINYIREKGFKIVFIKDIQKLLQLIGEEQGIIFERKGLCGFVLNIITGNNISFNSKPMFIFDSGAKDFYLLLFSIYKLEGYLRKLPGFDYQAQMLFKQYRKTAEKSDISQLGFEDLNSLKEAVARDNEASEFVIEIAKIRDGAKNAALKMKDGGADV